MSDLISRQAAQKEEYERSDRIGRDEGTVESW